MEPLTFEDAEYYQQFPSEAEAAGITPEAIQTALSGMSNEVSTETEAVPNGYEDYYAQFPEEINSYGGFAGVGPDHASEYNAPQDPALTKESLKAKEVIAEADSLSKKDLYGTKPTMGIFDATIARWQDVIGDFTGYDGEPTDLQKEAAALPKARADWEDRAKELYVKTGVEQPDGSRIYSAFEPDPRDPSKIKVVDYEIPKYTSNMWSRIIKQGALNLGKDADGISRGEFTTDSSEYELGTAEEDKTFSARNPSMQLSGGEQLMADLWTLAVPLTAAAKPAQLAFRGGKYLLTAGRTSQLNALGRVTATTVAGSVLETLFVSESNEGLLIGKKAVQNMLPLLNLSDEAANDIAVLLDGLIINGAMDGVLTVAAPVFNYMTGKGKVASNLRNLDGISQAVQDGLVLKVAQFLDPELVKGSAQELSRNLKVLSKVLNNNAVTTLKIADFEKQIPVPTTQAIMTGAEAYMRETRQHLKKSLGDGYEEYIQQSSDEMYQRMIAILRSNSSNPAVAGMDAGILNQMGDFFVEFADSRLPGNLNEATDVSATNLVRNNQAEQANLGDNVDVAAENVATIKSNIDNVVTDDPDIELLLEELNAAQLSGSDRTMLTDWTQSTAYKAYEVEKDNVAALFKAIPNDPIGPEAAEALIDNILVAVRELNVFDTTGKEAKNALNKIYSELQPKVVAGSSNTSMEINDITKMFEFNTETMEPSLETRAALIERISGIGFQDVYNLRPTLKQLYSTYAKNPPLANRFADIRRHINDGETGQLSFAKGGAREAAEEADQAYKNFDNRWQSDEQIKTLSETFGKQRNARNLDPSLVTTRNRGVADSNRATTAYVDSALSEPSGDAFRQIMEAVDGLVGMDGPTKDVMSKYIVTSMSTQLAKSAVEGMDAAGLNSQIAPFLSQLRAAGNDELANQFQTTVENISKQRSALGGELIGAEEALRMAKIELKAAENGILSSLLSKVNRQSGGVGPAVRTDSREALADIISRPDANNTKELIAEINKLPASQKLLAQQALQSVALDTVGAKIFGSGIAGFKDGKALRNIMPSQIVKMSREDAAGLMKNLDLIFPEEALDPLSQNVREGVFNSLEILYANAGPTLFRDVQVGSNTAILTQVGKETRDAVSTSILVLAGYMNPTAAMLRRLTASSIDEVIRVEKEVTQQVLSVILTSPTEFATLVDLMAKRARNDKIRSAATLALRTARLDGRYQIRIREDDDIDETGNPVLDTMAQFAGRDMTEAALGVVGK